MGEKFVEMWKDGFPVPRERARQKKEVNDRFVEARLRTSCEIDVFHHLCNKGLANLIYGLLLERADDVRKKRFDE